MESCGLYYILQISNSMPFIQSMFLNRAYHIYFFNRSLPCNRGAWALTSQIPKVIAKDAHNKQEKRKDRTFILKMYMTEFSSILYNWCFVSVMWPCHTNLDSRESYCRSKVSLIRHTLLLSFNVRILVHTSYIYSSCIQQIFALLLLHFKLH